MKPAKSKVTALQVQQFKSPGRYGVGNGLYLQVDKRNLSRAWVFRYRDRATGKLKSKGLGSFQGLSLADARAKAESYRQMLRLGKDPIQTERAKRDELKADAKIMSFGDCLAAYIKAHSASWRSDKHATQWANTLSTYAKPLMKKPINSIGKSDVLKCLETDNFWISKTETATRVRQRIESVIDYAKARDLYSGENPARWRGNLKELLPAPGKLKAVEHHPALPYAEMAGFMKSLEAKGMLADKGSLSIKSLAFTILTASRVSEAVNAQWREFDFKARLWRIPKDRMKAGREHTVPLSNQVISLLKTLNPATSGYVFPNGKGRNGEIKPITDAAPRKACKELNSVITVHGFRSTFRDWAADMTTYPREVAEAALAHTLSDKTEAAYRRSDLLGKRASLMSDWAKFCFTT